MLAQDLFEASPSSLGQNTLKQLQSIADSGQDGNLSIGVDMMPIQSWQATYLMGIYKALNQRYGVDRALSMMGNYDFIDRALERQEAKLSSMSRVGSVPGERGIEEQQLDEIGNTPAGQAALQAVGQRADDTLAAWAANPKSGYSSTPAAVAKASQAGVAASNRQYGFGPDKSKINTVMARDALRQQQIQRQQQLAQRQPQPQQGMAEGNEDTPIIGSRHQGFPRFSGGKSPAEMPKSHQGFPRFSGGGDYTGKGADNLPRSAKDMVEEVRLPYPEGSENLGRANMELLIKAYNEPTSPRTVLQFGNKIIELDRQDIEAIADYYDDKLPDNAARWNFIRSVMNSHDNVLQVLHQIGRRSAASVKQPGLFQEASKKKEDDDLGTVRDVTLQRAITKAKADFPTAGSGLEALAKDFMQSQEQDRRDFDQLQTAKRRHDQLLTQISKVDQEQQQEIQDLEDQNSSMSQRLQQLQKVNTELERKLAAMTGRRDQRAATPKASTAASTPTAAQQDVVVTRRPKVKAKPKKDTKPKTIKIRPGVPAIGTAPAQLSAPETPKLPAPDMDNILPPMFRRPLDPEFVRGKETATDIEVKEPAQIKATATAESSKSSRREADYGPDYQDMVQRVAKLAKEGPRKTVWDPVKKVYKTVPVNAPKKISDSKPDRMTGIDSELKAVKNVSDWAESLRIATELRRDTKLMSDPEARSAVQKRIDDLLDAGIKQGYMK